MVGAEMGQRLVDSRVEPGGHQRILEPVSFRRVVMHIVGGDQRDAGVVGNACQPTVAHRVPLQKILLKLDVDRAGAVPGRVLAQLRLRLLPTARQRQARQSAVTSAGQQNDALRMRRQMRGIEPGFPAVNRVCEGKQTRNVRVTATRLRQQREPGAIQQGQLAPGDGRDAQAAGQARELQRPAQIGIGQGQGGVAVLLRLRQQFMGMGGTQSKGIEAFNVKLDVADVHFIAYSGPGFAAGGWQLINSRRSAAGTRSHPFHP